MNKFIIYDYSFNSYRYEYVDVVYFSKDSDIDYVRYSLINHDGYSNTIKVYKA